MFFNFGPSLLTPQVQSKGKVFDFKLPIGKRETIEGEENIDDDDCGPKIWVEKPSKIDDSERKELLIKLTKLELLLKSEREKFKDEILSWK